MLFITSNLSPIYFLPWHLVVIGRAMLIKKGELTAVGSEVVKSDFSCISPLGGGGTPLFGLYGDVPLDRVWFFGFAVLNRVYNLTCVCPKQGQLS